MQSKKQHALNDVAFAHLREQIERRSGLHFPVEKKYILENRLNQRLKDLQMESFDAYVSHLKKLLANDEEWDVLLNLVTTRETYFYRDVGQLSLFTQELLPPILAEKKRRGDGSLRIASAACSSGDEVFTLGILIQESGIVPPGMQWEVVGMDISPKAIQLAREAVYGQYALRHVPKDILAKFFEELPGRGWQPNSQLRQRTRFLRGNLMESTEVRALGLVDVVFCRNVLIYFDSDAREKILTHLARVLNPGGFIVTGFSETPKHNIPALEIKRFGSSAVYHKTGKVSG